MITVRTRITHIVVVLVGLMVSTDGTIRFSIVIGEGHTGIPIMTGTSQDIMVGTILGFMEDGMDGGIRTITDGPGGILRIIATIPVPRVP